MYREIRKIETARRVVPLGKGLSVYLPQEFVKSTGLKGKDLVDMWTDGSKLIVKPAEKEPSIRELFANYTGEYRGEELDWGGDVGGETHHRLYYGRPNKDGLRPDEERKIC